MDKDTNLHKELDLIQNCIGRMAKNSFMLKGWSISLMAVVLALTADRLNALFLLCSVFIPLLCFWYLDAFFLRTERMYRKMYEWVLKERANNSVEFQYDLNPKRFEKYVDSIFGIMRSDTLLVFYGIPALLALFIILYKTTQFIIVFIKIGGF